MSCHPNFFSHSSANVVSFCLNTKSDADGSANSPWKDLFHVVSLMSLPSPSGEMLKLRQYICSS